MHWEARVPERASATMFWARREAAVLGSGPKTRTEQCFVLPHLTLALQMHVPPPPTDGISNKCVQ